jgi:hypothetical protein
MDKTYRKLKRCGELSWVLGVLFVALGVALCKKADLGVSMIAAPAFIIYEKIGTHFSGLSIGMTEYLVQGVLLILMCTVVQRVNWRYLLCFAVAVIYGYALDLWLLILGPGPFETVAVRWIMLFVGDVVTATGVAFFFRTYMPLQVYELFVAEFADRYRVKVEKTKYVFDAMCFAVSVILAFSLFNDASTFDWSKILTTSFHCIGVGTVITSVINAPIIAVMGKLADCIMCYEPLFPKLYAVLHRKSNDEATTQKE